MIKTLQPQQESSTVFKEIHILFLHMLIYNQLQNDPSSLFQVIYLIP